MKSAFPDRSRCIKKARSVFKAHKWLLIGELASYVLLLGLAVRDSVFHLPRVSPHRFWHGRFHRAAVGAVSRRVFSADSRISGRKRDRFCPALSRAVSKRAHRSCDAALPRGELLLYTDSQRAVSLAMQLVLTYRQKHLPKPIDSGSARSITSFRQHKASLTMIREAFFLSDSFVSVVRLTLFLVGARFPALAERSGKLLQQPLLLVRQVLRHLDS